MDAEYGYDSNTFKSLNYTGSANAILIGDDNLLYCGADTSRWTEEGCSAVCDSSDSSCPFARTTAYPETTVVMDPDLGLNETCEDSNDYTWIIRLTFEILVSDDNVDITTEDGREIIRNSCKRAFFRSIVESLVNWLRVFVLI